MSELVHEGKLHSNLERMLRLTFSAGTYYAMEGTQGHLWLAALEGFGMTKFIGRYAPVNETLVYQEKHANRDLYAYGTTLEGRQYLGVRYHIDPELPRRGRVLDL